MIVGITLIIVCGLIALIWITSEIRKIKHKIWALFLIILIIFGYISFTVTTKNHDLDLRSFSGIMQAFKIYFSWLGNIFGNIKSLTGSAVQMDWSVSNSSLENS